MDPYYAANRQWLKNEFKVFCIGAVPFPGTEDVKVFAREAEKIFTISKTYIFDVKNIKISCLPPGVLAAARVLLNELVALQHLGLHKALEHLGQLYRFADEIGKPFLRLHLPFADDKYLVAQALCQRD
jgi:hypothetical protein